MKDHRNRAHALLSASGSARWLNCPPSARLEDEVEDRTSPAALEGTLAHELAELELSYSQSRVSEEIYTISRSEIESNVYYDSEMEQHVEDYVDYVKEKSLGMFLYVENKLDLSHVAPESFGSLDAGAVNEEKLIVIDFKYGRGVTVSVERNTQLRLYASGLLKEVEFLGVDPKIVEYHIYQPRAGNVESWSEPIEELNEYLENEVKPIALKAFKGEGERKTGDWCTFCKVAATCPAQFKDNLAAAKIEFGEDLTLETPSIDDVPLEVLAQIHLASKGISGWLKKVSEHLTEQAGKGVDIPGLKLVEGKPRRRINQSPELLTDLRRLARSEGLKLRDLIKETSEGVTALEKILSADVFKAIEDSHISKNNTAPSLVSEDSTRPALDNLKQAIEDFK